MKDSTSYNSYVAYELLYTTKMGKEYSKESLFPDNWYSITNYQFKIKVLLEALNKNISIYDTDAYNSTYPLVDWIKNQNDEKEITSPKTKTKVIEPN